MISSGCKAEEREENEPLKFPSCVGSVADGSLLGLARTQVIVVTGLSGLGGGFLGRLGGVLEMGVHGVHSGPSTALPLPFRRSHACFT